MSQDIQGSYTPSGPLTVVTSAIAVPPDTIAAVLHERRGVSGGAALAGFLGVAISIWSAYFTASFHDALGVKAAVIESIFLIVGLVATIGTIISLITYLSSRKKCSVDSIVAEIIRRSKQKLL